MDSEWLKKVRRAPTLLTTYRVGLVQAKAFRILNARTVQLLEPHGIRPLDWALLGALHDGSGDMLPSGIAELLGVKAPHVTSMLARLKKQGLVSVSASDGDRRQKRIGLTAAGKALVPRVEKELRSGMRGLLGKAGMKDVLAYVHVLSSIVENGEED